MNIRTSYDSFRDLIESALKEASNQIIQKEYESQLTYEGYDNLIKYGMSFKGKKCRIALVK